MNTERIELFRETLLEWFRINGRQFPWRKKRLKHFERIITEILLQRTQAKTVSSFYKSFFLTYKNWNDLADASAEQIGEILKPIGLWQQRSKKLQALGSHIVAAGGNLPKTREQIDLLPGVGQYVANAIELFILKKRKPLLDVNMARVLERYFGPRKLADIRYDPYLQELAHRVVDCEQSVDINFAILDHAALICKARKPLCEQCPVSEGCLYYQNLLSRSQVVSQARRK